MPIPRIVHFTIPSAPTEKQFQAIESCRSALPDYEVKVWQDPISGEGFRLSDYWEKTNSGAQLADLIRLEVVYRYGGIYLDSDIEIHKPFDDLLDESFIIASEDGNVLTNAVFGAEKNSPLLDGLIEYLLDNEPNWDRPPNQTTGPYLFARHLKWQDSITVLPKDTFYPYNWNEDIKTSHPASYVTHAWDGSWLEEDLSALSKQSDAPSISTRAKNVVEHIGQKVFSKLMPEDDHFKNPSRYTAEGTLCVETVHDFKILLQGSDLSITPHVTTKGCYERKEEDFIKSVLRGGDYFVDVGANVGVFTLLAAQMVGPFGRVFAFEPNPTVADLLRRSAVMNWWHDRVVVSELGVGADNSDAIMHLLKYRNGDSRVTQEPSRAFEKTSEFSPETEQINIQITSLDQYFPYNVPIRFLKIDVEGFEDEVLKGASRLISNRCIDYIMVETIREVADDFDRLLALLATLINGHYGLYALDHNGAPVQTTVEQVRYDETPGRNLFLIGDWV